MKLSRLSWIFIAIGLALIVIAGLGRNYWIQAKEQGQLEEQLSSAKQKLAAIPVDKLNAQKEQLEKQLIQINSQIQAAGAGLSGLKDSIGITDNLLDTAVVSNVTLTDISALAMIRENLSGLSVNSFPLSIKAEGSPSNLVNFAYELSRRFPNSTVKTMNIITGSRETPTYADIRLVIYAYQGSQK